jgi:hypothetical protein
MGQIFASSSQEKTNDNELLLVNLICNEINTNGNQNSSNNTQSDSRRNHKHVKLFKLNLSVLITGKTTQKTIP